MSAEARAETHGSRGYRHPCAVCVHQVLAPAALETMVYRETQQADISLGIQFLAAARRREASLGVDVLQGTTPHWC